MFLMRASSYLKTMLFFMFVMGTMFNAAAPVMNLAVIFPNPAYANSSLVGYCNATTLDGAYVSYNFTWYLNDVANISGNTNTVSVTGGTITYTDSNGLNPRSSPPYANGYTVHTFTTSGTFNTNAPMNVSILIVAGGGTGGKATNNGRSTSGGGGGAGGLIYNASFTVTSQSYNVTVGGTAQNSVFSTLNAIAGGAGGYQATYSTAAGGASGGSGGGSTCSNIAVGSGTAGQGNNGGGGFGTSGAQACSSGGGGGAGGAGGTTGALASGGAGGIGLVYSISGSNVTYATGGAGYQVLSTGGNGAVGAANTGNGGGGAYGYSNQIGGAGGSGIVIIRYQTPVTYASNLSANVGNISNASLAVGQNWTLQCSAYNANGTSSALNSTVLAISSPYAAPNASTFGGSSSTNLAEVADLSNVTNLTLETVGKGKIQFPPDYSVNAVAQNYDAHVKIENGFVSVNSSALDSSFNAPAQLEINTSGVYAMSDTPVIKYYSGFTTDIKTIIRNGVVCTAPRCTNIVWNNVTRVLTFNVSGFSGYAISDTSYGYDAQLGINITSTNQIAVYTSNGLNDTVFDFKPVTPPAGDSVTLMSNETSNTTTGETGFLIQNQGNVNVSINVSSDKNASAFIGGTASLFQMFGAENGTGACADINTSAQDLGATGKILCPSLRFTDSSDIVWSYILIKIDSDSPPRTNKAVLTFTSTQVQ